MYQTQVLEILKYHSFRYFERSLWSFSLEPFYYYSSFSSSTSNKYIEKQWDSCPVFLALSNSKESSLQMEAKDVPKGYFADYVGMRPKWRGLWSLCHPMGDLTIPCGADIFINRRTTTIICWVTIATQTHVKLLVALPRAPKTLTHLKFVKGVKHG